MIFRSLLFITLLSFSFQKRFEFNQNHTFTILQVTDMHYGESDSADISNSNNLRFYITKVQPDIVIITGDLVSGYAWDSFNQSFYQNLWSQFSVVFNETQTYYAYALGNHDHQANFDRKHIVKLDMTHPFSVMNAVEELDWASTYNVPIFSSFNETDLAANLWMFDSGDQYLFQMSWGKITDDQMSWFREKSQELRKQNEEMPHSLAFFHIPIPEFKDVWNYEAVYGEKYEKVGCPLFKHGTIFDQFLQGGISGVFCGHDHNNYYGGWKQGIELVYGRKTGHGGYGPTNFTRGVRVITLKEKYDETKGKIVVERNHHIFDENGEVILNGPTSVRGYEFQIVCNLANSEDIITYFKLVLIIAFICLILWRLIRGHF